jgi:DnaJ family protein A protein 5
MNSYVEPSWSSVNQKLDELDLEEEKRDKKSKKFSILQEDDDKLDQGDLNDESGNQKEESDGENDSEEYDDSLFCVACDKSFKSAKSFENHEKSKKHKDNIELLKKHMKEEDMNLFFDRSKDNSNGVDQNSQDDIKKESNETKQK